MEVMWKGAVEGTFQVSRRNQTVTVTATRRDSHKLRSWIRGRRAGIKVQAVSVTVSRPDFKTGRFTVSASVGPLSNPISP